MDGGGKQQKRNGFKTPVSRPHLSSHQQPQSSPTQLPSQRQHLHSTPNSLPAQYPQVHSTNQNFCPSPDHKSSPGFDYDTSNSPTMPTSTLLTQLLQEKKASQAQSRLGRRNVSEFDAYKRLPRTASSDQSRPEFQRHVSAGYPGGPSRSGSSDPKPKEMGAREMMAFIDKIKKENFDLKLQLYHHGQKRQSLETQLDEKIEAMQVLVEENAQLREANDRLSHEVQKTQQAVDEAVAIICDHEDKLADLGVLNDDTRPSTARPADAPADTSTHPAPFTPTKLEVPDRGSSKRATNSAESSRRRSVTPRTTNSKQSSRRTPSFLRESNGSSNALRNLYLNDENKSKGAFSVMSMTGSMFLRDDPEPETATLDSPRLSVLSESSFLSVYGSPKYLDLNDERPGRDDAIFQDTPIKTQRVHQWIKGREGHQSTNDRRSFSISTAKEAVAPSKQPSDNDDAAPAPDVPKHDRGAHQQPSSIQQARAPKPYKMDSPSLAGPIFNREVLPPTPDTMSTANAQALNGSNSSIIAEKSLVDQAPTGAEYGDAILATERPHTSDGTESRSGLGLVGEDDEFDSFTDETQFGRLARRASLVHTNGFMSGGSSKAIRFFGPGAPSHPRLSCYGGDLMFNGEEIDSEFGHADVFHMSPERLRPLREDAQMAASSVEPAPVPQEPEVPPRTSAEPTQPVENPSRRTSTSSGRVSFSDDCKEPRPSTFRVHVPPVEHERRTLKRSSLKTRMFSRASSRSGRASDTDSCTGAAPPPPVRDTRPPTAGSGNRRRRASISFFGWRRSSSRDGPPAQPTQ